MLLLLLAGAGIGIVLGLTGAGGGILAVPALVATMGWDLSRAAPVALMAVAGAASLGTLHGFRQGLVRWRAALLMALAGVPFTWLGQLAAQQLSQALLQGAFALIMLVVAVRALRSRDPIGDDGDPAICQVHPETGRFIWSPLTAVVIALVGSLAGFLTGMLGVGGGFAIVPTLRLVSELTIAGVVSTSLMVISLVSGGSILISLARGVDLDLAVAVPFLLTISLGMLLGRRLMLRLPQHRVMQGFGVLLIVIAASMLQRAAKAHFGV